MRPKCSKDSPSVGVGFSHVDIVPLCDNACLRMGCASIWDQISTSLTLLDHISTHLGSADLLGNSQLSFSLLLVLLIGPRRDITATYVHNDEMMDAGWYGSCSSQDAGPGRSFTGRLAHRDRLSLGIRKLPKSPTLQQCFPQHLGLKSGIIPDLEYCRRLLQPIPGLKMRLRGLNGKVSRITPENKRARVWNDQQCANWRRQMQAHERINTCAAEPDQ